MKERLELAKRLAVEAGKLVMEMAEISIDSHFKDDKSIVTQADIEADRLIREALQKAFPEDGLLTEETATLKKEMNRLTWIVDPIDGTKAYAKKTVGYSVMIGLLKDSEPILGVVYEPLEGWLYYAERGKGAFGVDPDGKKISLRVSSRSDPKEMKLLISPSMNKGLAQAICEATGLQMGESINSVGVKVARLVRQQGDVYYGIHPIHYWDSAAPLIIALEAGAKATLLDGSPFRYDLKPPWEHPLRYLISNGTLHDELLPTIKAVHEKFLARRRR